MIKFNTSGRKTISRFVLKNFLKKKITGEYNSPVKSASGRRFRLKKSAIRLYLGLFVLVVTLIFVGYSSSGKSSEGTLSSVDTAVKTASVDDVIETSIASSVAQVSDLPVANSVSSLAISTQVKSEIAQPIVQDIISKPQIILSNDNMSVASYVVVAGDTVDLVASKNGISSDTIKWANNLLSNTLTVGTILKILPVDGVLYTVKSSDTVDSIASRYQVDATRVITYNNLDTSGLVPGSQIILPGGILPENERPGYVAVTSILYSNWGFDFSGRTWYIGTGTGGCPYAYGNCTCYAYSRRVQLGLPVGSNWGNANTWAYYAATEPNTYVVNNTPSPGAIFQGPGGTMHVGIVEEILPNGDISISEMNASVSGGGWNVVSGRIISASSVSRYLYIH